MHSIIGLSFLKFDKIIPCPKKDVSSATYTKTGTGKTPRPYKHIAHA